MASAWILALVFKKKVVISPTENKENQE